MSRYTGCAVLASLLFVSVQGRSATLPGGIGDDYWQPMHLEKVSVGLNLEDIHRFVELDAGKVGDTLDATSYSLFLGYDMLPWLTLFGTLGLTDDDSGLATAEADSERMMKWSLGLNGNMHKWEFRRPRALMGDRLTIKCFLEYADYRKDSAVGEVRWNDLVLAVPIAFERFERNPKMEESELFRLSLYVGPMLSLIDGTVDFEGGGSLGFQEGEALGLLAGADIYFTSSVSLGAQVQMFDIDADDMRARASVRYHF